MDVVKYLEEKSAIVEGKIREIVPKDSRPQEVYGPIWDLFGRGGKRLRPAMCLLASEAVGGDEKKALVAAAAIEMFHNFTLIHDDIEDASLMRRGKPCLHIEYGMPLALNAGDGLFMMVWKAALQAGEAPEENLATQKMLLGAFTKVLEGQAVELGWHRSGKWDVTKEEYLGMAGGKTGALIEASCRAGAFLGGGAQEEIDALAKFGMGVGIAFQIQDDVLNIIGDEKKYRKEIGGDIVEGKRTLIVMGALEALETSKRKRLLKLLKNEKKTKEDVEKVIALLKESGAVQKAQEYAIKQVDKAKEKLDVVKNTHAKKMLWDIADYLVVREV